MQDACQVSVLVYQLLFYSHTTFIQQKIAFVWNSGVNILHLHREFVCIYTLRFYYSISGLLHFFGNIVPR